MDMEPLLWAAMAVGLILVYPGWRMCRKAFAISRRRWLMAPLCLLVPAILAAAAFCIPFLISKGKQVAPYTTFSDLLLFAICPLGLLALIGYVLDHFSETSTRAMFAGTACFAIVILPILYYLYSGQMHAEFDITPLAN